MLIIYNMCIKEFKFAMSIKLQYYLEEFNSGTFVLSDVTVVCFHEKKFCLCDCWKLQTS